MNTTPDTRASLLIRVRDPADQAAWSDFVQIYRPLILRLATQMGMQPADAEDVAQQILMSVAGKVQSYDPGRAKFRTWLNRVAQNAILNALTRVKPDQGSGDTEVLRVLQQYADSGGTAVDILRLEHQRELFRWASRQVRNEFNEATWAAFWLTAVEGKNGEEVAERLGKNRGAIYAARCRVIRRIQEKVDQYNADP